jgi:hypothetical protein
MRSNESARPSVRFQQERLRDCRTPFQFGPSHIGSQTTLAACQFVSFPWLGPSRNFASNHGRLIVNGKILGSAILLIVAFDPSLFARHRDSAHNVVTVPMHVDTVYWMVGVSCEISGGSGERHLCVIDSGASHTVISDKVLKPEGPTIDVTTGNGVVRAHARHIRLTIGEGLQLDSLALVQPNMTPSGVEILVGQDVLRQFRSVTFNYERQEVEFRR